MNRTILGLLASAMTTLMVLVGISPATASPAAEQKPATRTVENWTMTEFSLTSKKTYPNPFLDVDVTATFHGPNGEVITRPGFWDGDLSWKVRFAATAVGTWKYQIASSDTLNVGLAASGTLRVTPYSGGLEIYERGFLSAGDSTLTYGDGSPFFWLGDTHWFFDKKEVWEPASYEGAQFTTMVDRRVSQKFTVYQSVIFGSDPRYWAIDQEGVTIDPGYFKNELDRKMDYIADSGLVNAFGVGFHSNIDDFVEGSERLAEYVVARYGAYPVVWMTSGEGAGYDAATREARIDGWRQVARTIHAFDDYDHPQTAHSPALTEKQTFGLPQFYEGEGWFDFEMLQGGHLKFVPPADYDHYRQEYAVPFLESEANYEQIYDGFATDTIVRQTAYRSIQAGGFGYGYGAHGIWNATANDSDTADDYGYGHENWSDAIDFIGADQMTHLIDFYRSIPLNTMVYRPDAAVWDGEFTPDLTEPITRADAETTVLTTYFSAGTSSKGAIGLPDGRYLAQWFDPRDGSYTTIDAEVAPDDGQWRVPEKPDEADWVLLVTKQDQEYTNEVGASRPLTSVSVGKPVTRFGGTIPKGLTIDLGEQFELAEIVVRFPGLLKRNQYLIEGSVDGATWFTVKDRTGAPVFGATLSERVSGTARYVRLTLTGLSRLAVLASTSSARSVKVEVLAKVGSAATARSTRFLVDDLQQTIAGVPTGIDRAQFLAELVPTRNASLAVLMPDGVTEVTEGGIASGMKLAVTSQDGQRTRLYDIRTGFVKGDNLARTAVATASSVESTSYLVTNVNDGNNSTETWSGWAGIVFPAWVQLDFGEERTFNRVDLYTKSGYEQKGYTLQFWDGTQWSDITAVSGNTSDHRAHIFDSVTSSKLRVWMTEGNVRQDDETERVARINELEVYFSPGAQLVSSLTLSTADGSQAITSAGGTLQLNALSTPVDASDTSVAWSVTDTSGNPTIAALVSDSGLLTARRDGTARVTARALDGSAVVASIDITITGQGVSAVSLLSLNKPTTSSSTNRPSTFANDGDENTAWVASGPEFPQWIVVDLEAEHAIHSISQVFNNDDQWKYTLEGSLDGQTWTTWIDQSGNTASLTTVSHQVDATARYVRMTIVGAKDVWPNWASSKEFSIYGTPVP